MFTWRHWAPEPTLLLFIVTQHWAQYSILNAFGLKDISQCVLWGFFSRFFYVNKKFPLSGEGTKMASYLPWVVKMNLDTSLHVWMHPETFHKTNEVWCTICYEHCCRKAFLSWITLNPGDYPGFREPQLQVCVKCVSISWIMYANKTRIYLSVFKCVNAVHWSSQNNNPTQIFKSFSKDFLRALKYIINVTHL